MEPGGLSQAIAASLTGQTMSFANHPRWLCQEDLDTSLSLKLLGNRPAHMIHSSSKKQTMMSFHHVGFVPPCLDLKDPDTSLTLNSFGDHHQGFKIHSASNKRTASINHVGMKAPSLDRNGLDTSLALNTFGNRPRFVILLASKNQPITSINHVAESTRPPSSSNERTKNRCAGSAVLSANSDKTVPERKRKYSMELTIEEIEDDFLFITGKKRPSRTRRALKRPRSRQQLIDNVFPGGRLSSINLHKV